MPQPAQLRDPRLDQLIAQMQQQQAQQLREVWAKFSEERVL
jgi:hypothetical protein